MDTEKVLDMLGVVAQHEAAQMFLGTKQEVLSSDAMREKLEAEKECRQSEGDVVEAQADLEQRLKDIEDFENCINDIELQQVYRLVEEKKQLTAKINAAKQALSGAESAKAKEIMAANILLENRLFETRRRNELLRQQLNS